MCLTPIDLKNAGRKVPATMAEIIAERKYKYNGQNFYKSELIVPCGKCVECLKEYSEIWALRVSDEAKKYSRNCVITLTYNDEYNTGKVSKRDVQLFIKRLRKHLFGSEKGDLRYFACGEYGSKHSRPHYHIILFNYDFDDKVFWSKSVRNNIQYRSETLEKLWKFGFSTIGDLSYDTAKYCAKYLQKLDGNDDSFLLMSRKPGLGNPFGDNVDVRTDKVYIDGGKYKKIPRYYLSKLTDEQQQAIKDKRQHSMDLYVESFVRKDDFENQHVEDLENRSQKIKNYLDSVQVI